MTSFWIRLLKIFRKKAASPRNFTISCITAHSILETEEFEFPAKTVFANNFMNINLRVRFLVSL